MGKMNQKCKRSPDGTHKWENVRGLDDDGKKVTFLACKLCRVVWAKL